jgi:N-methylhydantoinase A
MREVLIPPTPGVLSALGGLVADLKSDFIRTIYSDLNARATPLITETFADLEATARRWLRDEQGFTGEPHITYAGDLRYGGQSYEIETIFDPARAKSGDLAAITEGFHVRHEQLFGHADRHAGVQVINLRLVIAGQTPRPSLPLQARATAPAEPKLTVKAWLEGAWHDVPLYMRTDLTFGHTFSGPAVVAQPDCTTIIPHGCHVRVDEIGNLRISIGAGDSQ